MAYFADVGEFLAENRGERLAPFTVPLKKGLDDLQAATMWFMANALVKPDNAAAGATDYMHLFGLVALAHMWGRIAAAAERRIAAGDACAAALRADLAIGRAYVERALPETALRRARIEAGADAIMAVPAAAF
jgi:D-arabinose 1-dehydrogenase-like Zn-dependent alcohol dehydrogenase